MPEIKATVTKKFVSEAVLTLTKLLEVKPNDEWASFYRFIAIYESSQKAQDYAQLSDACSCGSQKDQVALAWRMHILKLVALKGQSVGFTKGYQTKEVKSRGTLSAQQSLHGYPEKTNG